MNKLTIISLLLGTLVDGKRLVQLRDDVEGGLEESQTPPTAVPTDIEGNGEEENGSECRNCAKKKMWGKPWIKKTGSAPWKDKVWEKEEEEECECDFIEGDICDFEPDVDDCILEDLIGEPGSGQGSIETIQTKTENLGLGATEIVPDKK